MLLPAVAVAAALGLSSCCLFRSSKSPRPTATLAGDRPLINGNFDQPDAHGVSFGSTMAPGRGRSPASNWTTVAVGEHSQPTLTYWQPSTCPEGGGYMVHVLNPGGDGGVAQDFDELGASEKGYLEARASIWIRVAKGQVRLMIDGSSSEPLAQVFSKPAQNGAWHKYCLRAKAKKGSYPVRLMIYGYSPQRSGETVIFDVDNAEVVAVPGTGLH